MPSPTTFFVPFSFSFAGHGFQEPKAVSDTPTGAAPQGAPGASQQQPPTAPAAGGGLFDSPIVLMLMVFVAFMLFTSMRRDSKARKAQQAMLSSIKQGDRIITTGGMHGVVHKLEEKTVTLRFEGTVITFDRAAIARVERDGAALEAKKA